MIYAILLAGLVLRLISLDQSLWFDEGINIMAAKSFTFTGMLTDYAAADFHPPLWFGILWIWGKLFGYSEAVLRLPSVFFGLVTLYVVYLIGKKLVSQKVGLLSALLLAINPLHIYYSQEARMYALAALAVSVNVFLIIKIAKGEKVNFIWLMLSSLFVLLSDYIAYFIFPAQFTFLLLLKKKAVIRKWALALGSAVILNFWWWPVFLRQLDTGALASANLPTWKFVAGSFDFKTLPLTFVKFIIGRVSLANKILYAVVLLPILSIFFYLIWKAVKNLNNFAKNLLLLWLFIPLAIAIIISLAVPVYNYFRVLYILPAFVILTGVGTLSLKRFRNIFLTVIIVIEIVCALFYLLIPSNQREDWKGLADYFKKTNPDALILFESSGTFPAFDYYAKGELNAKGALKDFPAGDYSAVSRLSDITGDRSEVYLADYLVQISDPQRFAAKKLNEIGYREKETKDFHGVGFVYHYVKK